MAQSITGHTRLLGLLGSPVSHSISPQMHNTAFEELGLDYRYLAFDVGTEELKEAVEGLKALNARGFNVTMPDKNLMCSYCDKLSPASEIAGAVNTVVNDNGVLTGYTTDGLGYLRAVRETGFEPEDKKMTLLGAGGAATSILVQAALDGVAAISVFSLRDDFWERLQQIVGRLRDQTRCQIQVYDFEDEETLRKEIGESDLLANGTNVGMAPDTEKCIIQDPSVLRPDLVVSDVIYNPKETKLVKMAKSAGCTAFGGMNMLLYQGAESFKLWTGQEMPVELVREKYFS